MTYCVVNLKRQQPVNTFLLFERDETSMQLSFVAAPVDKPLTIFSRATFNYFFFFSVMKGALFGCEKLKLLRKCQTFHIGAPATRHCSRKRVFLTGPPAAWLCCRWRPRWERRYRGRSPQDRVRQRAEEGRHLSRQLSSTPNARRLHASMRSRGHVWGCICPPTLTTLLRQI